MTTAWHIASERNNPHLAKSRLAKHHTKSRRVVQQYDKSSRIKSHIASHDITVLRITTQRNKISLLDASSLSDQTGRFGAAFGRCWLSLTAKSANVDQSGRRLPNFGRACPGSAKHRQKTTSFRRGLVNFGRTRPKLVQLGQIWSMFVELSQASANSGRVITKCVRRLRPNLGRIRQTWAAATAEMIVESCRLHAMSFGTSGVDTISSTPTCGRAATCDMRSLREHLSPQSCARQWGPTCPPLFPMSALFRFGTERARAGPATERLQVNGAWTVQFSMDSVRGR